VMSSTGTPKRRPIRAPGPPTPRAARRSPGPSGRAPGCEIDRCPELAGGRKFRTSPGRHGWQGGAGKPRAATRARTVGPTCFSCRTMRLVHAFSYRRGYTEMSPSTTCGKVKKSDRRIPGHRDLPIAGCGLFNMGKRREGIVESHAGASSPPPACRRPCGARPPPDRIVIEKGVPAGVAHEQKRRMGQIRPGRRASPRRKRRRMTVCPGEMAGRADRGDPGNDLLLGPIRKCANA